MIETWLKLALQSTYQGAHYAGARTPRAATRIRGQRATGEPGEHGRDDRFTGRCGTVLPAIDAEPRHGTGRPGISSIRTAVFIRLSSI
jgi:hypothetical protein